VQEAGRGAPRIRALRFADADGRPGDRRGPDQARSEHPGAIVLSGWSGAGTGSAKFTPNTCGYRGS